MATIYIGLGSNMGDKHKNMLTAVTLLAERVGEISALSSLYETAPWGFESENDFLNAAVAVETTLTPSELLSVTQQIEREVGRAQKTDTVYHDRVIDIDLLLMERCVLQSPELTLPHPLMHLRVFVLEPLAEIAPELVHPLLHKTIGELYSSLIA